MKFAYEFLACHVGTAIYDNVPELQTIRDCFINKSLRSEIIKVERLSAGDYDSFHGIIFEENNPHAKVQIRLFGWLAFRVHFLHLSINGLRFVYIHRLNSNEELVDVIEEAGSP